MNDAADGLFRALADPTRRAILGLLREGAQSAGELAERFPQTKASLSHHFAVLHAAGLVRRERRGQNLIYSLNTSVVEDLARMWVDLFPGKGDGR